MTHPNFASPGITVLVGTGDSQQSFVVHHDVVCPRSRFFTNALNGHWKESEDRTVPLPIDDPAIFKLYIQLLYTGAIVLREFDPEDPNNDDENQELCKLYVMVERLQDDAAKNSILEALVRASEKKAPDGECYSPGVRSVSIVYEGTMPGDPARRLMVDFYTWQGNGEWIEGLEEEAPGEFWFDLCGSLMKHRKEMVEEKVIEARAYCVKVEGT